MIQEFVPAIGLGNCHAQTIFPRINRPKPWVRTALQWFDTPDGDRLAVHTPTGLKDSRNAPIVMVLHGLEGSVTSPYIQGIMQALRALQFQVAVMHFRGCGGIPNRLPRAYHSGDSEDPRWLAKKLKERFPNTPLMAVGYSLGGNVLLKWLGEDGEGSPLNAAVAVSAPMDLHACSRRIDTGLSRFYQRHLLKSLRESLHKKSTSIQLDANYPDMNNPRNFRNFRSFDDAFTAPLHGFINVDDYYNRASSKPFLKNIQVPTLIVHAEDDPFISPVAIPGKDEISGQVKLEVSARGGHVGFIAGSLWKPEYWLEKRIPAYLATFNVRKSSPG